MQVETERFEPLPISEYPDYVSVIIPVYNDAERLSRCLSALENQSYPKNRYEVLVIDNGSKEPIEPLVANFKHARLSHEKRNGSYAARNKGISIAKGEIIAFTDSDCIPAQDWIEKGVANLHRIPNVGLVAGKIDLFFRDPSHPTAVELYQSVTAFQQKVNVEESRFGVTANIFTFRKVFNRVGKFDGTLQSGGDFEWGQRVYKAGFQICYAEDVCVAHPARHSLAQLHKRVVRVATGLEELRWRQAKSTTARVSLFGFVLELCLSLIPILRKSVLISLDQRFPTLKERIKIASIALYVQYIRIWEKWRFRLYLHAENNDD